jgi:hypothetical protein
MRFVEKLVANVNGPLKDVFLVNGATTFNITTLSITTLSLIKISVKMSNTLSVTYWILLMLIVAIKPNLPSVFIPSVMIMLSVVAPSKYRGAKFFRWIETFFLLQWNVWKTN